VPAALLKAAAASAAYTAAAYTTAAAAADAADDAAASADDMSGCVDAAGARGLQPVAVMAGAALGALMKWVVVTTAAFGATDGADDASETQAEKVQRALTALVPWHCCQRPRRWPRPCAQSRKSHLRACGAAHQPSHGGAGVPGFLK
jgi:hypothetical protein